MCITGFRWQPLDLQSWFQFCFAVAFLRLKHSKAMARGLRLFKV